MARGRFWSLLVVSSLLSLGCSSNSDTSAPPAGDGKYLGLDTPTDGFQVRDVGTTIPPGEDLEFCEVAELPGDPSTTYFVGTVELANGKGSHHLIVSVAPRGGQADAKLRAMNIGDRIPCFSARAAFGEDLVTVGGIQQPYGKNSMPDGIAKRFHGGDRVVFDYHYYNATQEPVEARSAFNFHLIDEAKVKQLAGGFGFYNWLIDTPPGQQGSFGADCRFQNDATVGGLTRHTHRWGRDFTAWFAGGPLDGELIWTTPDFETNVDHDFEPPVVVHAGQGFKFQCTYDNTETRPLRFGVKATDEMCILFGETWDPNGAFDPPEETCDVTWLDANEIGHPATYPGAFPAPSAGDVSVCLSGAGANAGDCTTCSCNSCASVLIRCFTDPDCGPIIKCATQGGDCESVIEEHSPGIGLAQQVRACNGLRCSDQCAGAGPDGGADAGK